MSSMANYILKGVELPSMRAAASWLPRHAELLQAAVSGRPAEQIRVPQPVPVFANADGDEVAMLPTPRGQSRVDWISGSPIELLDSGVPRDGGFISSGAFQNWGPPANRLLPDGPTHRQLVTGALQVLKDLGMLNVMRSLPMSQSPANGSAGSGQAPPAKASPGGSDEPPPAAPSRHESKLEKIGDFLTNNKPYISAAAGVLGSVADSGNLQSEFFVDGVGGAVMNFGMQQLEDFALGLLGDKPDDNSSTAEWATKTVGPLLLKQWLSMGNWDKFFGGGPPKPLALRMDDLDEQLNQIKEGFGSVEIENHVAARDGDKMDKAGVQVTYGALSVLIGGKHAGRAGYDDSFNATGVKFEKSKATAKRTQIGGPSSNPSPPFPNSDVFTKLTTKPIRNPKPGDQPPKEPIAVLTNGEWRIYDPHDGYNSTPAEIEALSDWDFLGIDFGDIFEAGKTGENWLGISEEKGHWYLLGGMIDLGSPEWPNAGTGSTWWVPDKIFGIDMADFYGPHDWYFRPDDPAIANDFWALFRNTEIPTFLGGLSWCPVDFVLQVIYSLATSLQAIRKWVGSWAQARDEKHGYPDKYGHHPHIRHEMYRPSKPPLVP